MVSDVTGANWFDEPMTFVRPMFGGKVFAEVAFPASPVVVTARPNSFAMDIPEGIKGEYEERTAGSLAGAIHTRVVRVEETKGDAVDLTEADLIVAGGRGLKATENFKLVEELAAAIGGTVGATRSVVDAKWRDQADQIGKSGKTVSPKLYIGAGISVPSITSWEWTRRRWSLPSTATPTRLSSTMPIMASSVTFSRCSRP